MSLFLDDGDVRLYHGDALETLRQLPTGSVDMVATSPPFYGLRDYGTGRQIGLEETPDQWVTNLIQVFRECRRVLADHGTLWVEIGDSYSGSGPNTNAGFNERHGHGSGQRKQEQQSSEKRGDIPAGTKPKDLLGQPWMLAFALRADGWYLRSEIIWARPNPMPESVMDRPTKSHSTVFLLSKFPRYYFDSDAIRSPHQHDGRRVDHVKGTDASFQHRDGPRWPDNGGANARSVWNIPTQPTPFAHFATWPQKLVARMIQAGTSERGKCPECGKPWVRQTTSGPDPDRPQARRAIEIAQREGLTEEHLDALRACGISDTGKALVVTHGTGKNDLAVQALADEARAVLKGYSREFLIKGTSVTTGWAPSCSCVSQNGPPTTHPGSTPTTEEEPCATHTIAARDTEDTPSTSVIARVAAPLQGMGGKRHFERDGHERIGFDRWYREFRGSA